MDYNYTTSLTASLSSIFSNSRFFTLVRALAIQCIDFQYYHLTRVWLRIRGSLLGSSGRGDTLLCFCSCSELQSSWFLVMFLRVRFTLVMLLIIDFTFGMQL